VLAFVMALAVVVGAPPVCRADGTVMFSTDIIPLLMQRPVFGRFLLDTLDFSTQASGTTIGANVNPALAMARIGPYTVLAKKKGSQSSLDMDVVINTDQHYYDAAGKETDDITKAASVRETFASIEINPLGGK
jgi:hypothetical protein